MAVRHSWAPAGRNRSARLRTAAGSSSTMAFRLRTPAAQPPAPVLLQTARPLKEKPRCHCYRTILLRTPLLHEPDESPDDCHPPLRRQQRSVLGLSGRVIANLPRRQTPAQQKALRHISVRAGPPPPRYPRRVGHYPVRVYRLSSFAPCDTACQRHWPISPRAVIARGRFPGRVSFPNAPPGVPLDQMFKQRSPAQWERQRYVSMNARRSAFTLANSVVHMPCGAPG
jgi:hypothetical protein